jgi:flagellar biogenesis protein FliO
VDPWTLARALYALALVGATLVALRAVLSWLARRRLGPEHAGARFVRVVETTVLAHGAVLHVVRVGDAYRVIAVAPGCVTYVCEVAAAGDSVVEPVTRPRR